MFVFIQLQKGKRVQDGGEAGREGRVIVTLAFNGDSFFSGYGSQSNVLYGLLLRHARSGVERH